MIVRDLQMIDMNELVRLRIYDRLGDTWAWVALGPERQQVVAAGAAQADQEILEEGVQLDSSPAHAAQAPLAAKTFLGSLRGWLIVYHSCWMREGLPTRVMVTTRYHIRGVPDRGLVELVKAGSKFSKDEWNSQFSRDIVNNQAWMSVHKME
ncbi:hypothetical protein Tco_0788890 [Tanacetum coccineum]